MPHRDNKSRILDYYTTPPSLLRDEGLPPKRNRPKPPTKGGPSGRERVNYLTHYSRPPSILTEEGLPPLPNSQAAAAANAPPPASPPAGPPTPTAGPPPASSGAAGPPPGPAFPFPPPLPSVTTVNSGLTPEQMRLQELQDRVRAFEAMRPPQERGLPLPAAIAAGILGAIDPEGMERLQPQIDRFRRAPIEDFERRRTAEAQNLTLESALIQAQTDADARQREELQHQEAILGHFRSANDIITGALKIVEQMATSKLPSDQAFSKELFRRVMAYRTYIEEGMNADVGTLGKQFLDTVHTELEGVTKLINQQQGFQQRLDLANVMNAAAYDRAEIQARARAAQVHAASKNRMFRENAKRYLDLSQLLPIIKRAKDLVEQQGAGGPLEGQFPTALTNEVDRLYSMLKSEVLFGQAGKAVTAVERIELAGKVPTVTSLEGTQLSQLEGARLQIQLYMNSIAVLVPGLKEFAAGADLRLDLEGMPDDLIPGIQEDDQYGGSFDLDLLGLGDDSSNAQ